jgi:type IV pilus assembly protein PilA
VYAPGPLDPRRAARWRRRASEGFTLIELMIVVAIVGILSAIAIPQYQIYSGKAQLTEAIHITASRKAAIGEAAMLGEPLSSIMGGNGGIPADVTSGVGKYVESLVVDSGTIIVTMLTTRVSPCVIGAVVTLSPVPPTTPDMALSWVCTTNAICKPSTCA